MSPWLESLGVLLLAAAGALVGVWFSRQPGRRWLLGYLVALGMIILYGLGSRFPAWTFTPPISWMMAGRNKFAIIGFIGALALATPLMKLPLRRDRIAVGVLAVCIVLFTSVWPFLAPAFNRTYLAGLVTNVDNDGVCRQNTDYTCGPAAAVTALRQLGFSADEGEIAILAHTSSATGTPPDILADALREKYARDGLVCEYRLFKDVAELKHCGPTLAVIKFNLLLDHYVTVLDVNDNKVVVGDPLNGLTTMSVVEFREKWRFVGVVLKRD